MHHADHIGVVRPLLGDAITLMTVGPDPQDDAIDLSTANGNREALSHYCANHPVSADDVFSICWTSGTTGTPKGVPRSHNHWVGIAPGTFISSRLQDGDIMLNPFPLINMASIGGITMSWLRVAGTMVLHHPFDPQIYLAQIATERPSFTIAPPAVLNMLLQNEALLANVDLSSLRTIGSGSAPLAPAMVQGFQDRLNLPVLNIFGSNEGMSLITGPDDVPDPVERASFFPNGLTIAPWYSDIPQHIMDSRLVPPDGGDPISQPNIAGELHVRGPTIFDGYWNAPDQTAAAFTDDGWFKTGDLFQLEEGGRFLRYVGRCKDLIIRGGMNISPEELDQLLGGHPMLIEACVFALPDPVMGERIGVAVVPKQGQNMSLADVTGYLRDKDLAVFKLPERLFLFNSLPRNVTNKVMRSEVRAIALKMMES